MKWKLEEELSNWVVVGHLVDGVDGILPARCVGDGIGIIIFKSSTSLASSPLILGLIFVIGISLASILSRALVSSSF